MSVQRIELRPVGVEVDRRDGAPDGGHGRQVAPGAILRLGAVRAEQELEDRRRAAEQLPLAGQEPGVA